MMVTDLKRKFSRQHQQIVANFKSPTSGSHRHHCHRRYCWLGDKFLFSFFSGKLYWWMSMSKLFLYWNDNLSRCHDYNHVTSSPRLPSWFWVQRMPTTCLCSLISMVSWSFQNVKISSDLGNINESLSFEYGDGAIAVSGCSATLNGEFWYFGGSGGSGKHVSFCWPILLSTLRK